MVCQWDGRTANGVHSLAVSTWARTAPFGWPLKIPKGLPRRYDLPSEDTLRLALMTSPHEPRGLLMMYAGLRLGECCAITTADVSGDPAPGRQAGSAT